MISQPVEDVCAVIWRNYMLVNNEAREGDDRRSALYRFIRDLNACPEYDFDILQVAGAVYLKKLDEFGEDRDARRAGAEAAARSLKSRIGQADP